MNLTRLITILIVLFAQFSFAQNFDKKILNWYNEGGVGMNTNRSYKKLLKNKKPVPVIVAVIDSGVDIEHEDLQGHIWINEDEIPDNGIDDDNNGYIDDIHGWNFLGNEKGEILNEVQLEMTRIVAKYKSVYEGKVYSELNEDEKKTFDIYKAAKEMFEEERDECKRSVNDFEEDLEDFRTASKIVRTQCGGECSFKELKTLMNDPVFGEDAAKVMSLWSYGFTMESYNESYEYWVNALAFNYNLEINPRLLIGDDPSDFKDIGYGNNNVKGEGAEHGTHVSGIIAGVRGNGFGGDGVSDAAVIMSIRAVPDGDEWDKDVALAIRYAVDNGASVINMSFGKPFSPFEHEVIAAFRYAEENDVLLVHGAGNESANNDKTENYPTSKYKSMNERFSNWLEVGASTRYKKVKLKKGYIKNRGLVTDFSNYGLKMVDVFAPGHDIISSVPDNQYDNYDGTSMASPMVAGVAALLKSYYPNLSMIEIKDIIIASVQDLRELEVIRPTKKPKLVLLESMCVSGGVVNVYNACLMAEEKSK
jgi:subtilisin family serine protease